MISKFRAPQGFPIEMEDGVIAIGFDDQTLADRAREIDDDWKPC